jgi:zinc protease
VRRPTAGHLRAHSRHLRSRSATAAAEHAAAPPSATTALPGRRHRHRLANGLDVLLVEVPGSAIVSTTLWYRAGSSDEPAGHGGVAHFLEHMMFKGSPRYGPGQIDRRTQALGGSNNAYTSHDATVYYFKFAARVWREALAIEADRMAALTLDPREVDSERQVILEEVAMYESDPWDALDQTVSTALFGSHPYARPVLGSRETLLATGAAELAAFHRGFYRPDGAALVMAGAVGEDDLGAIEATLGALAPGASPRLPLPPWQPPAELERVERRHGEVPRLMLALPAPPADHPDHPLLRVLVTALADGRTSRLRHDLVEERELCLFIDADAESAVGPGTVTVEAELHEGAEPREVEERVLAHLRALAESPLNEAELARARVSLLADWVFGNEQAHQQALTLGFGVALFDEAHAERNLAAALAASAEELQAAARRWLVPERGVVGWALPAKRRRRG